VARSLLPPQAEHLHPVAVAVDPRLDATDEVVAEDDRKHVVAPTAFRTLEKALPDIVEVEQAREQRGVP
jgi:hypothetical protein